MSDTKSKVDSLKMLKEQMRNWNKQDLRKKAGKQEPMEQQEESKEEDQQDLLTKLLAKLLK